MIVNNVPVNFDRIMRITLYYGNTPAQTTSATDEGFNEENPTTVILEYAPLDNAAFCPDLEVSVLDITNPGNKNERSGFTAKVTIKNPDEATRRIISNHLTYTIDFTEGGKSDKELLSSTSAVDQKSYTDALTQYYNSRVRIKIEAGYWRSERANTALDCRDYSTIFEGYINSNAFYRKGIDDYMILACHNLDLSGLTESAIRQTQGLADTIRINYQKFFEMAEEERNKRSGKDSITWANTAQKLIRNFSQTRPTKNFSSTPVQPWDRVRTDWYGMRCINGPNDKDTINLKLEDKLNKLNTSSFYTLSQNLYNMLSELCTYKDANVNFEIDDTYKPGVRMLFVWPLGEEIRFTKGSDAQIQIVNYQNLLEAPSAEISGALNIKMLFNPTCKPQRAISLILTDDYGSDTALGVSSVRKGKSIPTMSFQGNINYYTGTQQGAYNQAVHALQVGAVNQGLLKENALTRGYLFNTGFPIERVTHNLATRGNKWETIVKTIPAEVGISTRKAQQ